MADSKNDDVNATQDEVDAEQTEGTPNPYEGDFDGVQDPEAVDEVPEAGGVGVEQPVDLREVE